MLLISIPAFILADKWGRRTSTISGGLVLSGIMLLMGSLYASGIVQPTGIARWVVVVSVFLFGMVFCATWGISAKIYASEIQPGNTRAASNSVGMAFSFVSNFGLKKKRQRMLTTSAHELVRHPHYTYSPGRLRLRCLLPLWWHRSFQRHLPYIRHARDSRPFLGRYPNRLQTSWLLQYYQHAPAPRSSTSRSPYSAAAEPAYLGRY